MKVDLENGSSREEIKEKLRECFDGKIVRKDLTKKIKEGANVPVYVLEFLLGQYCSSDDEKIISEGVEKVKHILAHVETSETVQALCAGKSGQHECITEELAVFFQAADGSISCDGDAVCATDAGEADHDCNADVGDEKCYVHNNF